MDKRLLKKKIFDACFEQQVEKIRNIETAMSDAQESANEDEPSKDIYDASRMMMLGKRDMYAQQLQSEMLQLETLHKIDLTVGYEKVEFGAVAETSMQKVFISIGLGKFMVENETYFAISPKVPFFQAMRGMKSGDTFVFRGEKIKILNVY
ncbi:MAG: hypothetical protein JXA03_10575 [Bacteroidales bacterium]|nr:hypothetical protein [Bacteroidales bacterium]